MLFKFCPCREENENNPITPPADIPLTTPSASRKPIIIKRYFGRPIISSVTMPALYLVYSIEKYITTYLFWGKNLENQQCIIIKEDSVVFIKKFYSSEN